eukprot:COSAG06_NODE_5191_length_3647_cov_51.409526_2_plen_157_part_00
MEGYGTGDVLRLLLDSDAGTLTIKKNGVLLGVAVTSGLTGDLCWAVAMYRVEQQQPATTGRLGAHQGGGPGGVLREGGVKQAAQLVWLATCKTKSHVHSVELLFSPPCFLFTSSRIPFYPYHHSSLSLFLSLSLSASSLTPLGQPATVRGHSTPNL